MVKVDADRNLLLGILAYQNAFVKRDALLAAMQAWLDDKSRSVAEILEDQRAIDSASRQLLEAIAERHIEQHGGDPARSLDAIDSASRVREELGRLPDTDLQASLARLHTDAESKPTRALAAAPTVARHRTLAATLGTALLLVGLGAIGVAWLVAHAAEEAKTAQVVNQAMGQANTLREQALAMVPGDTEQQERAAALWRDALAAGDRVEQALANGPANAQTQEAAQSMLAQLRDQANDADKDHTMLQRLEAARELSMELRDADYVHAKGRMIVWGFGAAEAYDRAFREYGIDVDKLSAEEVGDLVRQRRIRLQLASALDHWYFVEPTAARGKLLEIASRADGDPLASRARAAIARNDGAAMKELSADAKAIDLPTSVLLLLVEQMHQIGFHADGLALIRRARRKHSGNFWIQAHTGIYLAQGPRSGWDDATRAYAAALALRPRSYVVWSNLGMTLIDLGHYDEAVTALRRSSELNPNFTTTINWLSAALIQKGEPKQALAVIEEARSRLPDSPMLLTALGNALRKVGRHEEAFTAYQQAVAKEAHWYFAQEQLAELLAEKGEKAKALALLDRAQEAQPTYLGTYITRWRIHCDQGDYDAAIKASEAAVACKPQLDVTHHALATALYRKQRYAEAAAEYRIAARLSPGNTLAFYNLGSALVDHKQFAEALDAFEAAVHWNADRALFHRGVGEALMHQKRCTEATLAFQRAAALEPKSADAHSKLSWAYDGAGDHERAEAEAALAIELDPQHAVALNAMGNALYGQGRFADAVPHYQKALAITPKDGVMQMNLGRALYRNGDFAAGHAALASSVNAIPADNPSRATADKELKECERALALDKQIQAFQTSGALPKAAKDVFALADVARRYKQHHSSAAALYARIFTPEATPIDELIGDHRYRAVLSALLTAAGKARDLPRPSPGQKAQGRDRALRWLRAELDQCTQASLAGKSEETPRLIDRIARWKTAPELEIVREPALALLPADEQMPWRELWEDAELFVKVARARILQVTLNGALSPVAHAHMHEVKLIAKKTYVFELDSTAFDTLLKLQDADGKVLAENDDIGTDNRIARIAFTPPADGVYRLIATSVHEAGTGPYSLRIGALNVNK
jgi:tetratricopeptide (TPR) repeat protein